AVEQEGRAHGRASGEYVLQKLPANDGHAARFGIVLIVEPAARADGDIANLVVLGRDAKDLAVGGSVIADGANVFAVEHRRNILERAGLAADGEVILISEMVSAAGLRAAFNGGDASREGEHDVLAKILQLLGLAAAKALAQADQQEQRPDAPGNAEHGKKRAQFVGPEGGERLAHDFDVHPHELVHEVWFTASRLACEAEPVPCTPIV